MAAAEEAPHGMAPCLLLVAAGANAGHTRGVGAGAAAPDGHKAPQPQDQGQEQTERDEPPAGPTSVHGLPDELLVRVLLHLGTSLHLVHAAATCRRWRRAVADAGFLARFRSLHGVPSVAGHYYVTETLHPNSRDPWRRQVPEKMTATFVPVSPAVVDASHFSLDFLYVPPVDGNRPRYSYRSARRVRHSRSREIIDSRGSLLLLTNGISEGRYWSPDFIVCEPLTRRCQGIARPSILSRLHFLGGFLLDGSGSGGCRDAMSNFRVLSVLYKQEGSFGTPRACVFSPGSDGGWHFCWHPIMNDDDDDDDNDDDIELPTIDKIHLAGRAAGRIYWGIETGTVLVLDESTLMFSVLTLPEQMRWPYRRTSFRVVGGVDGDMVRIVRLDGQDLVVYGQILGSGQWVVEKSVRLRDTAAGLPGWRDSFSVQPARIVAAGDTFVVLTRTEKTWLFSVDLETMEAERRHERNRHAGPAYPCSLPWPPVLQAGLSQGDIVVRKRSQRRNG
ncbi:uncharacterized protein LOC101784934 [Setaria italica]|nr:uncharacterized protein LOC101784934 [Setaria italica]